MTRGSMVFMLLALCGLAGIAMGATVTQSITYQGTLTNSGGTPLSGTYTMTIRLYDVPTGGTALETITRDVPVTEGQFTEPLSFDPAYFDGRALWLGIKVGADPEMTPRQEIRPVPYAMGLRPGAVIQGSGTTPVLKVEKDDAGGQGMHITTTGESSVGVLAQTFNDNSNALFGATTGKSSYGVYGIASAEGTCGVAGGTTGDWSVGVFGATGGANAEGVRGASSGVNSPGVKGIATGLGSPAVYGDSTQDVGIYGKGKEGGYFTTNQAGTIFPLAGVNVSTTYFQNPGIRIKTTGDNSGGVYTETSGASSHGVIARTIGSYSYGVHTTTYGNRSLGVSAFTHGANSEGLSAITYGADSEGLQVVTFGNSSDGVYAETHATDSRGITATTDGDYSIGMAAITEGGGSQGVYTATYGVDSDGLYVLTYGNYSQGAYASTDGVYSDGVSTETFGYGSAGVAARAYGQYSQGVYAYSQQANGVDAVTEKANHEWGVYTDDYIYAGGIRAPDVDLAEYMPVSGDLSPGTVLIIGPDGKLQASATAGDTRVAGIVSTSPAIALGTKLEGNPGEAIVAIAGRVPCRVDASDGPIHPGDVLSTSSLPGYAMKAVPVNIGGVEIYKPSTVLGKALGTLESGTGTIEVLVTLQ